MKHLKLLLASAAVALAPVAQAATAYSFLDLSQMTITAVGNISYTLNDPMNFGYGNNNNFYGYGYGFGPSGGSGSTIWPNNANGIFSSTPDELISYSEAGSSAHAVAGPAAVEAFAQAQPGQIAANAYSNAGYLSVTGDGYLLFSVPYQLSVTSDPSQEAYEWGSASFNFVISASSSDVIHNTVLVDGRVDTSYSVLQASSGNLTAAYVHVGPETQYAQIFAYADANVSSTLAPVPEPESYAMLLAGLALMGTVARRRQQKAA